MSRLHWDCSKPSRNEPNRLHGRWPRRKTRTRLRSRKRIKYARLAGLPGAASLNTRPRGRIAPEITAMLNPTRPGQRIALPAPINPSTAEQNTRPRRCRERGQLPAAAASSPSSGNQTFAAPTTSRYDGVRCCSGARLVKTDHQNASPHDSSCRPDPAALYQWCVAGLLYGLRSDYQAEEWRRCFPTSSRSRCL